MHRTIILTLTILTLGSSAVRWATDAGIPYHRTDFTNIVFQLNATTAQTLTSDGDPAAAIQAALASWNSLPDTALHFAPLGSTTAGVAQDSQNVITFANSAETISAIGGALALTVPYGFADGRIVETDIILNPAAKYSVTQQAGTYDLQSIITHELGHTLGANHATVVSSTMFWVIPPQGRNWSTLKADDAAFAAETYPAPSATNNYGKIAGTATKDGAPLSGAGILAVDSSSGAAIGGLSSTTDGTFTLTVPAGSYQLYAGPITPFTPNNLLYGISPSKIDSGFKPASGGSAVQVSGAATASANIAVTGGPSALGIDQIGKRLASGSTWGPSVVEVPAGQSTDIIVFGTGLNSSITEQNVAVIGAGVQLHPGSLSFPSSPTDSTGRTPLRFTLDVATRATPGSATIYINKGSDSALLAGGIAIVPVKPTFTAASIVDAASSQGAGVAPGELISLYGQGVGPTNPAFNGGFDPSTGALATTLGGVSVTFDGIPAPMLYASSGQLNLQVPYEVSGKKTTTIVVKNQGTASDPIAVTVLTAQPGLFQGAGSLAIAVNQDGSINGPSSPAPKGTYVTFYATGAGAVNPPVATGKPAPSSPLSFAQSTTMTIGGSDAPIYQGGVLSPGFVGLLQIAAQVPANASTGSFPAILTIAGQSSTPANIFVK